MAIFDPYNTVYDLSIPLRLHRDPTTLLQAGIASGERNGRGPWTPTSLHEALMELLLFDYHQQDAGLSIATYGTTGPDIFLLPMTVLVFDPALLSLELLPVAEKTAWADCTKTQDLLMLGLTSADSPVDLGFEIKDTSHPDSAHAAAQIMADAMRAYQHRATVPAL